MIICTQEFPVWKYFGSLVYHFEFVKDHQEKVRRIAIATDGILPKMMGHFTAYFVKPEVKQFPFDQIDEAIKWARADHDSKTSNGR